MIFDFTIHNDPGDFSDAHGLYFMVCYGWVDDSAFYFGLQTDVFDPALGKRRGKGLIFSRWGGRDLADAQIAGGNDGWAQSSGHEGDFIGVRRAYDWGAGDYQMRITADGEDDDGEWYAVWLTDEDTGETLWVGSLKFPLVADDTMLHAWVYSTLEIYGAPSIRPIYIPEWYVSIDPPNGDGFDAAEARLGYSGLQDQPVPNANAQYDDGRVHLLIGAATENVNEATSDYSDLQ